MKSLGTFRHYPSTMGSMTAFNQLFVITYYRYSGIQEFPFEENGLDSTIWLLFVCFERKLVVTTSLLFCLKIFKPQAFTVFVILNKLEIHQ